jgi:hypothetical protein
MAAEISSGHGGCATVLTKHCYVSRVRGLDGVIMDGNNWRELYRAALLEPDLSKLQERVKAAEEAIRARTSLDGKIFSDERVALQAAISALNVLK